MVNTLLNVGVLLGDFLGVKKNFVALLFGYDRFLKVYPARPVPS